jgi:lysozyme family protein
MGDPVSSEARFSRCLAEIFRHEGGYADHSSDPGGATNFGITHKTLARWRKIDPWWKLDKAAVKAMKKPEASEIYKNLFWDRCNGSALVPGIDLALFDYAVNSGPDRAIKGLQRQLAVLVDGYIGPLTLAALEGRIAKTGAAGLIGVLCDQRIGFLERLATFSIFGRGWTSRVAEIRTAALAMAGALSASPTQPESDTMTVLAGYRTYIIAAGMLIAGISQLLGIDLPSLDGHSAGQLIMEALAVAFLRRGISNDIGKA